MTRQPVWKYVTNLGDRNPLEHGGYFIYTDTTGVYPPEGEIYDPDEGKAYRFSIERFELWNDHLIPFGFSSRTDLHHSLEDYIVWFDEHINDVSDSLGVTPDEYRLSFTCEDIRTRAIAHESIGHYFGFEELDNYPLELSKKEAKKRYRKELRKIAHE